jgi:Mn2+/Fe2+ NRAMP family transporter
MTAVSRGRWLSIVAPGMLVAATGVGAGDLLTASMAGSRVGVVVVIAALVGGLLKWTLNEGIARWQLATGTTRSKAGSILPRPVQAIFAVYFLLWTVMVGGALVNACGVAGAALLPVGDPASSKIVWGVLHSLAGFGIVRFGGFRWFERAMSLCVGALFLGVVVTALLVVRVDGIASAAVPTATTFRGSLPWVLAVLGGVGGTVTLLSYGYWIRETPRRGLEGLRTCRIDLGVAYAMTALFGASMAVIGSRVQIEGQGTGVALALADQLASVLGPFGRWSFLLGFWSAVFSSLLGVWQSAPFIFADFFKYGRERLERGQAPSRAPRNARSNLTSADARIEPTCRQVTYAGPLPLLWGFMTQVQLTHAILSPVHAVSAVTLLVLNNRSPGPAR